MYKLFASLRFILSKTKSIHWVWSAIKRTKSVQIYNNPSGNKICLLEWNLLKITISDMIPTYLRFSYVPAWAARLVTWVKSLRCRRSESRVEEWAVTQVKQRKGRRMSCDLGKATERLLILQPFRRLIFVRAHSPTCPSPDLRQSSFSNLSVAWSSSELILQPFRRLIFVTAHSPTLPSLYLRHSSFSNPSVASPTSQLIL